MNEKLRCAKCLNNNKIEWSQLNNSISFSWRTERKPILKSYSDGEWSKGSSERKEMIVERKIDQSLDDLGHYDFQLKLVTQKQVQQMKIDGRNYIKWFSSISLNLYSTSCCILPWMLQDITM